MTKTPIKYEISDQPTGKADAIYMQHDVDYSVSKDDKKYKMKQVKNGRSFWCSSL